MKPFRFIFTLACAIVAILANAQNIVVEETFDSNELGWAENLKPDAGETIITEGEFRFEPKKGFIKIIPVSNGKSQTTILYSDAVMPIDPAQGFEISVDMKFNSGSKFFGALEAFNSACGLLLDFEDEYNFIAITADEKYCYFMEYKSNELVRYKQAAVKMKNVQGKTVNANLKVKYEGYKLKVYVDDIEMTAIPKIEIETPNIALFSTGERNVVFDNVIIAQ